MDKTDKRYQGYKVSPGAQLYVEDLEQKIKELKEQSLIMEAEILRFKQALNQ